MIFNDTKEKISEYIHRLHNVSLLIVYRVKNKQLKDLNRNTRVRETPFESEFIVEVITDVKLLITGSFTKYIKFWFPVGGVSIFVPSKFPFGAIIPHIPPKFNFFQDNTLPPYKIHAGACLVDSLLADPDVPLRRGDAGVVEQLLDQL